MQIHRIISEQHGHKQGRLHVHHQSTLTKAFLLYILFVLATFLLFYSKRLPCNEINQLKHVDSTNFENGYKISNWKFYYQDDYHFYGQSRRLVAHSLSGGAYKQIAFCRQRNIPFYKRNIHGQTYVHTSCIWKFPRNVHHQQWQSFPELMELSSYSQTYRDLI